MDSIVVRGNEYQYEYTDTTVKIQGLDISLNFCEDWDNTRELLLTALCKYLGIVRIVFKHYRNTFHRSNGTVGLKSFFKHLGAEITDLGIYRGTNKCRYEYSEYGYYHQVFTIDANTWNEGKEKLNKSVIQSIIQING